jgi:hypothetical protein
VAGVGNRISRSVQAVAWPPRRSSGGDAALWVGAGACVLALAAFGFAATHEPGPAMLLWTVLALLLVLLGAAIVLWAIAYRQLTYRLGEDALEVDWCGFTIRAPYGAIDGVYSGQRLVGNAAPSVPTWPGIYVGPGRVRGIGRLRFFATSPDPSALTLITLEHGGLVVSARNPHDFRTALIERIQEAHQQAATRSWTRLPPSRAPWSAVRDHWFAICLGVGTLLLLIILALISLGVEGLPALIALRFDASGQASQLAPRGDLLRLPLFGLLGLAVNAAAGVWLHPTERLLARLLWLGGAVLQAMLLVAVVRLMA